ncbi:Fringe-like [Sergentomyia squamirostris]
MNGVVCPLWKMTINLPIPQRYKRILQAMTIVIAIIYMTLVLYQSVSGDSEYQNPPLASAVSPLLSPRNITNEAPAAEEKSLYTTKMTQGSYLDLSQVTGTPKPPTTELDDIFISVKTTKGNHDNRLALIIKTWFQLAKYQPASVVHLADESNRRSLCVENRMKISSGVMWEVLITML